MAVATKKKAAKNSKAPKPAKKRKIKTTDDHHEGNGKSETPIAEQLRKAQEESYDEPDADEEAESEELPAAPPAPNTSGWTNAEVSRLYELQARCNASENKWLSLKKQTADAKKGNESDVHALLHFIRGLNSDQDRPLLANEIARDKRLDTPVDEVFDGKALTALKKAGLATVGSIGDYTASGEKKLEDIPGIGSELAEGIVANLDEFWAKQGKPVHTADGRKISVDEMLTEVKEAFAAEGEE